jgi:pilus assembly protein Flp/PilA
VQKVFCGVGTTETGADQLRFPVFTNVRSFGFNFVFEEGFVMSTFLKKFVREEEGATMIEYGLMVALIAVVLIAVVAYIGTGMQAKFSSVGTKL